MSLSLKNPRTAFARAFSARIAYGGKAVFTRISVILAVGSIALGTAVVLIALSVAQGFEAAVQQKITGFVADIQITSYMASVDDTLTPIPETAQGFQRALQDLEGIKSVSPYIQRYGLLKSESYLSGAELKGIDRGWDADFIQDYIKSGHLPKLPAEGYGREIMISRKMAQQLLLETGDKARLYFLEKGRVRLRPVRISGIYETGLLEFDQVIVYCDIRLLQRIMRWDTNEYEGYEIRLSDPEWAESYAQHINARLSPMHKAYPASERFVEIYQWLNLQHQHVFFILVLMVLVAIFNMTSAIITLILEQTRTIGILKAIGATNNWIQLVFVWQAFWIITSGVIIGNILGLGMLSIQDLTGWMVLDQDAYYVREVPVDWAWWSFLGINALIIPICTATMLLPTMLISRIRPSKAIRFS